MKLQVNQKVKISHPAVGLNCDAIVLLNDLKGDYPVLIKVTDANGNEMCVQVNAEGSGLVHEEDEKGHGFAKSDQWVSYLFADGTATPFKPAAEATAGNRPAVGAMKAEKTADGKFTNHEYVAFDNDDDAPTATENPLDLPLGPTMDRKGFEDLLNSLFNKRRRP
jgi:hypothetical protein